MNSSYFKGEAALSLGYEENYSHLGFANPLISLVIGDLYRW
jgi:hypothetical protein